MVDQDPLPRWSFGRVTLLGDAAHPMVPRGSNGAGQAILDARRAGRRRCRDSDDPVAALEAYETAAPAKRPRAIVLTNRTQSARRDPARGVPAHRRPAVRAIDDVISRDELVGALRRLQADRGLFEGSLARGERDRSEGMRPGESSWIQAASQELLAMTDVSGGGNEHGDFGGSAAMRRSSMSPASSISSRSADSRSNCF